MTSPFAPIPEVIEAIRQGRMVVLVDDADRENEGDVIMAAQHADERSIAFMARHACGLICLPMDGSLCDRLGLPLMSRDGRSRFGTAFTLSIEAAEGVSTGISASDRAKTIQTAIAPAAKPEDIVVPGHVFPLRGRDGGVLMRAGHTEATIDLARMAGLTPAGVLCEIMNPDGSMARLGDLIPFAKQHGMLLATIADLIAYREANERLIELAAEAELHLPSGTWRAYAFRNCLTGQQHLALAAGPRVGPGRACTQPVLVRMHQEHLLADLFPGAGLPRSGLLDANLHILGQHVAAGGDAVMVYLRDASASRLATHLDALAGKVRDAAPLVMDARDYGVGAQILRALGVREMRLITASDQHIAGLAGHGLAIVERIKPSAAAAAPSTAAVKV